MLLYHGSNVEVRHPRLFRNDRRLDFGAGFYLTTSYAQAAKWAVLTTRRRGEGEALVSVFDFDETCLLRLNILEFPSATVE